MAVVTPRADISVAPMSLAGPMTRVTGTQGGSCLAEGSGREVEGGERGSMLVSTANWKVLSAG